MTGDVTKRDGYAARCRAVACQMLRDGWPRLVHPLDDGEYAMLYRKQILKRLKGDAGEPPPLLDELGYGWCKVTPDYE